MTAFKATYSDFKLIKTRQCVQIIFEVPLSDYPAAAEVLGGMPDPAKERWFGIAPLRSDAQAELPKAKKDWRDLPPSQQAGIRCQDQAFLKFLEEERRDDLRQSGAVEDCVRAICGVKSRAALDSDHRARVIWTQLNDQYVAWLRV